MYTLNDYLQTFIFWPSQLFFTKSKRVFVRVYYLNIEYIYNEFFLLFCVGNVKHLLD